MYRKKSAAASNILQPFRISIARDFYGSSIAVIIHSLEGSSIVFVIHSVDRSLFIRLIALWGSVEGSSIAPYKKWWAVPTLQMYKVELRTCLNNKGKSNLGHSRRGIFMFLLSPAKHLSDFYRSRNW